MRPASTGGSPRRCATSRPSRAPASWKPAGKRYEICSNWHLGGARIRGTVNGKAFTAQVERGVGKNPLAIRIIHNGTRLDAMVLTRAHGDLHALMPFKAPPDMSRYVLSPMPGLLVDVAVQPGQKVQAGERVAVIEAMKMENVLFAAADGVVGKVLAGKGESLAVDQPIVEFAEGESQAMNQRPFKVLGIQQIAIGGPDKSRLRKLWVDMFGLQVTGTFKSERENVDEDICALGSRARSRSRST